MQAQEILANVDVSLGSAMLDLGSFEIGTFKLDVSVEYFGGEPDDTIADLDNPDVFVSYPEEMTEVIAMDDPAVMALISLFILQKTGHDYELTMRESGAQQPGAAAYTVAF